MISTNNYSRIINLNASRLCIARLSINACEVEVIEERDEGLYVAFTCQHMRVVRKLGAPHWRAQSIIYSGPVFARGCEEI